MDKAPDANGILCRNGEHALREHHDRNRITFNGHGERRTQAGSTKAYISRCIADVVPERVQWLWKPRIALGKTNLLAGNPGNGKSQVTVSIAATTSTGGVWPDGTRAPIGSVVFISCEDDVADTIAPRLQAAGADLNRVHVLDWIRKPTSNEEQVQDRLFSLAEDVPALEALVREIGDVSLIVIDPVSAYVGSIDSHKASDVRGALAPLQTLAARTGAAVVLVAHLNKSAGDGSAMARVGGSGAFVAACRSAWLVEVDPQDEDRKRRILAPLKNNIGDDRTGFAFSIQSMEVAGGIETSRVVFEPGSVTVSAAELLRGQQQTDDERGAVDEAVDFLREYLKDGPLTSKSMEKAAKDAGIAARTIERARAKLKIKARKSDVTGAWLISLPDTDHRQDRQPPNAGTDGGVDQC
jgi:putative DNA primase/helicase